MAVPATLVVRRELMLFLAGPGLLALAVSLLFATFPWPTAHPSQALALQPLGTLGYLTLGAVAVLAAGRTCVPVSAPLHDRKAWTTLAAWSLGLGLLYGGCNLLLVVLSGARTEAIDRANGYSWANVALPWSLPHYAHAAIISECLFRLAIVLIPAWLLGWVVLRGRFQTAVFWTFGLLSAFVEPIEKAVLLRRLPFAGLSLPDLAGTLEAVAWQIVMVWLLRRYGWPAPMLMRFGYYLVVRVFSGYAFPPDSIMYPGPH